MRELIALSYSPWSEKAKWALNHHQVPYKYSEHLMIFGMPLLRYKMKKPFGDVTVPALISTPPDDPQALGDSFDIAQYADRIGNNTTIFPKKNSNQIKAYNTLSEQGLDAARALMMSRMQENPSALMEALPPWTPVFLRKHLLFVANIGLNYVKSEFDSSRKTLAKHLEDFREILISLRNDLAKKDYLLGAFSYADITMAVMLHGVKPVTHSKFRLSPEIRNSWTTPELEKEFSDLLAWRDGLYDKHR